MSLAKNRCENSSNAARALRSLPAFALAVLSIAVVGGAQAQSFKVFRPAAAGPAPAVIFVPGCSGFVAFGNVNSYEEKAQELQKAGYLVVFADYLRQLGQKDCTTITHDRAAGTIQEVAAWLRSQSDVDQRRISAIGWSFGGGALLSILASGNAAPFQKAVLFYPDCRNAKPVQSGTPTMVLLAGQDNVTPPSHCANLATGPGAAVVRSTSFPSARHGFDARGLPASYNYAHGTLGYNAEAAAVAWAQVNQFLK